MEHKKLNIEQWDSFKAYLAIDRKLSQNESAMAANKSNYKIISNWFSKNGLEFSLPNFRNFLAYMRQNGAKNSYLNKFITLGKHLDKYFRSSELADFTYFKEEREIDIVPLTAEEIRRMADVLIDYARDAAYLNKRNKIMILIAGVIGPRIGELINLKWSEVHETPLYFYLTFKNTKTSKQRKCNIGRMLGDMLMTLPRINEYVFVSYRGQKLRSQEFNLDLKRRAKAVGITKHVHTHIFRHSVPAEYLARGVELSDVSDIVGHEDPRTTMRYKHMDMDHYYEAQLVHPLLSGEMNWETQQKRAQQAIQKFVATKYKTIVTCTNNKIVITIENAND